MIKIGKKMPIFLHLPESFANFFYWFGAVMAVVGGFLALWGDRERDRYADEREKQSELRVSENEKQTKQAIAEAAAANERAAVANLATEQLRAKFAWRVLDPDKSQKVSAALAAHPSTVLIGNIANDPESLSLSMQVRVIFIRANWKVLTQSNSYANDIVWGLVIPDSPAQDLQFVREAFTKNGIFVNYAPGVPRPSFSQGYQPTDNNILFVMVGSKNIGL